MQLACADTSRRKPRGVEHRPEGYGLTPHGKKLLEFFLPLNAWADDWARLFDRKAAKRRRHSLSPLAG